MTVRALGLFLFVSTFFAPGVVAQSGSAAEGDIIISEILYSSNATDTDREYVEVYNATDRSINLENWRLVGEDPSISDPRHDVIDVSLTLDPGEFSVLCENGDSSENGGVDCAFDYANVINHENTADFVVLQNPEGDEIDRVQYDEDGPWPDAVGASIEYVAGPESSNNDPSNWDVATVRAGDFEGASGADLGSPNADAPEGALPVELAHFTVNRERNRAVLEWTTASETGNAGFAIQHRRSGAATWAKRGFVQGEGTTDEPHSYRYDTGAFEPGVHTFRLKQVDLDGAVHYSRSRTIEIPPSGGLTLHTPNPLRSGQTLTVALGSPTRADELRLYNILGQRLRTVSLSSQTGAGNRTVDLSTAGLSPGIYFVRVGTPGSRSGRRFTVIE